MSNLPRPCHVCSAPGRKVATSLSRDLPFRWALSHRSEFTVCPYPSIGPCQPSMVYRYLRTLEGVTPPLSLTHLSCQITAKAFAATRMPSLFLYPLTPRLHVVPLIVFDRMFSLGLRGSGLNTAPLGAQSGTTAQTGPRRHFLYCTLKPEAVPHAKRSREVSIAAS